jgi:hypothetical protein
VLEFGAVLIAMGLTATVLAPLSVIYCVIQLRRDADRGGRIMMAVGILAVIQTSAAMVYFVMLWSEMSRTGLGV